MDTPTRLLPAAVFCESNQNVEDTTAGLKPELEQDALMLFADVAACRSHWKRNLGDGSPLRGSPQVMALVRDPVNELEHVRATSGNEHA
jgi:hypothetical protein